jgi:hypothetical protein
MLQPSIIRQKTEKKNQQLIIALKIDVLLACPMKHLILTIILKIISVSKYYGHIKDSKNLPDGDEAVQGI